VIVRVLGTAAGGGLPQWNCRCKICQSARAGEIDARMQASIAVSSIGDRWLLVNATTDVRRQLELLPRKPSVLTREPPVSAVLLTDANIDHAGGLLEFRQSPVTRIFSSGPVRDALAGANPIFAPFARGDRVWSIFDASVNGAPVADVDQDLRVTALDVPGLMPSFAGGAESHGAATAFIIEEPGTGVRVLYAPVLLRLTDALVAAAQRCDAVFLDGSFWSDDELPAHRLGERTARQMGHAPIGGERGWLPAFSVPNGVARSHRYCTHVNNSNPVLDPRSEEARLLRDAGFALPDDGMEISLGGR
jgi:pyrroloquinoline quinone biosynthesis protein B